MLYYTQMSSFGTDLRLPADVPNASFEVSRFLSQSYNFPKATARIRNQEWNLAEFYQAQPGYQSNKTNLYEFTPLQSIAEVSTK